MVVQADPFADHNGLNHFNASRDHQQPPEKQHRDDGGRHCARNRNNPKQDQADAARNQPQLWMRTSSASIRIIACSLPLVGA
jgi:hypothetical protein